MRKLNLELDTFVGTEVKMMTGDYITVPIKIVYLIGLCILRNVPVRKMTRSGEVY